MSFKRTHVSLKRLPVSFKRLRFAAMLVTSVGLTGCASSSSGESWTKSAYCPWNWNPFSSSATKTDSTPTAVASSEKNKGVVKPSSMATPGISSGTAGTSGLASSMNPASTVPASGYPTSGTSGPMPNFNAGMSSYPQYGAVAQNGSAYPTTNYPATQYPTTNYPATQYPSQPVGAQPNAYQLAANGQQSTVSNPFSAAGNGAAGGFGGQTGAVTPVAGYGAPNHYGTPANYVAPGSGLAGAPAANMQLPPYQPPTGGFQGSGFQNGGTQNNVPVTPIPGVPGSATSQPSQPVYVPQQQKPVATNPAATAGLTPNALQDIASLSSNVNPSGGVPMIPSESQKFNPGQTGFTPPNTVTTNSLSNNAFRPGGTTSFPAANNVAVSTNATVSYTSQGANNVANANYNQVPGAASQNTTAGMNCANGVCTPAQKTDWTGGGTITPPASYTTPFQNAENTQSPGTPMYVK